MKKKPETPSAPLIELPETDLLGISRNSDRCITVVRVQMGWNKTLTWLTFGAANLQDRKSGTWSLDARFGYGVTDFEHDSAYILSLPLIGLALGGLGVYLHEAHFIAWVDPNDFEGFHVPRPGYDPRKHKDTEICQECEEKHSVLPEGFFTPKPDRDLWNLVRGKKVEISIGPRFEGA